MDLAKWFQFSKRSQKEGMVRGRAAISLQQNGIAFAYCCFDENSQPQMQFCEFYPDDGSATTKQLSWLVDIVSNHNLAGVTCSWVLHSDDYKLFMLEAPQVPDAERNMAVRWQIKELIDFPLEDAVIDTFLIPEFGSEKRRMLYIAVARQSQLQRRLSLLQGSGLALDTIDIVELTLRNLASLFVNDDSILVLNLSINHSKLAVCRNKQLYFARQIDVDIATIDDEYINSQKEVGYIPEAFDLLVTNIQQSLDYFEGQMHQPLPTKMIVMPLPFRTTNFKSYLIENLSIDVDVVDLNTVLNSKQELMLEVQANCLSVLGGVLRDEITSHVTTS